jgi:hypothetical protein
LNDTIFSDGRVWKDINFGAHLAKGMARWNDFDTAGTAHVKRSAGGVDVWAKSQGTVRASDIGLTRIERNESIILNELVHTSVRTTLATTGQFSSTIEHMLHGEIDIVSLSLTSNLDTIRETGQGSVRPAASTPLWKVLIETACEVADAAHVTPVEVVGQVFRRNVFVRKRRVKVAFDRVPWQINKLIPDGLILVCKAGDRSYGKSEERKQK